MKDDSVAKNIVIVMFSIIPFFTNAMEKPIPEVEIILAILGASKKNAQEPVGIIRPRQGEHWELGGGITEHAMFDSKKGKEAEDAKK